MTHQYESLGSIESWQVEQLRVTTFHVNGVGDLDPLQMWKKVIGNAPEQVNTRPKDRIIQAHGPFDGKQLTLVTRPGRIDWNLRELMGLPDESMQDLPTIGTLPAVLDSFGKVADQWLNICPDVIRLAFGAHLLKAVADRASASRELSPFLPNVKLTPDSQDFLYQINRPRAAQSAPNLNINRLTKWSVMQSGTLSIGNLQMSGPIVATRRSQLACRLELDINTQAESTVAIGRIQSQRLLQELVELGSEIAARGDIP